MYTCASWTIKKAEHWRTDAFKLWCWRILLRVPWTARRTNLSILKEINPEYVRKTDAEAPIPQPSDAKNQLIVKDPDAVKDWGPEWRGWQRMRWLGGMFYSMDVSLSKLREMVKDREASHVAVDGVTKSWTRLSNETITLRDSQRNVTVRGDYNRGLISVSSVK